jgi:hypothetical protein
VRKSRMRQKTPIKNSLREARRFNLPMAAISAKPASRLRG